MDKRKGEKLLELARRRGIFWQSYELYGGVSGFLDYGPLGSLLKRNIEEKWLDFFVRRQGLMLVETPIISPSKVFEVSGHLEHFSDPIVECENCNRKWRADHLIQEQMDIVGEGMTLDTLRKTIQKNEIGC
ncbi:MAG: glycine--tRNA ligase, partial [Candidatus Bathyarchaeota archaeon]